MNPKKHPNAAAGGLSAWLSGIVLYEATKRGVPIDAYEATAIVGVIVAAVLFAGRRVGVVK
jgi:hypothetical protein